MKALASVLACMLSFHPAVFAAQASAQNVAGETERPWVKDEQHFHISCTAVATKKVPVIAAKFATIWSPLRFHTTNSKFLLKFYSADIEFDGDPMALRIYKAGQPGSPIRLRGFPFSQLAKRIKDDDFPTIFERDSQIFEIEATSPLPRKMDGSRSMTIAFEKPFSLLVESVRLDGSRALGWSGTCQFDTPQAAQ